MKVRFFSPINKSATGLALLLWYNKNRHSGRAILKINLKSMDKEKIKALVTQIEALIAELKVELEKVEASAE